MDGDHDEIKLIKTLRYKYFLLLL